MANSSPYETHLTRARAAIARQAKAAEAERRARADRDVEVLAMLLAPGASLGTVSADVGLSKSMVAHIQNTARARFESAEEARAYLERHPEV